jgi:hypothetical protein
MAETDATIAAEATRLHVPEPYTMFPGVDRPPDEPLGERPRMGGASLSLPTKLPAIDVMDRTSLPAASPSPTPDGLASHVARPDPVLDGSPMLPVPSSGGPLGLVGVAGPAVQIPGAASGMAPYGPVFTPGVDPTRAATGRPAPAVRAHGATPGAPTAAGTARPAGTAAMPLAPMIPPAGARPAGGGGGVSPAGRSAIPGRRRARPDPNDPWSVRQGGPAVLEPAPDPEHHDPGPGVIGLER